MQGGFLLLCSTWHWSTTLPDLRQITARMTGRLPLLLGKKNKKRVTYAEKKFFFSVLLWVFNNMIPLFLHTTNHVNAKRMWINLECIFFYF